ncbi:Charged multivesicular body protein 3 [Sparganum proliferum]
MFDRTTSLGGCLEKILFSSPERMKLFGEKKDPREKVRELQRKLRREEMKLDREINAIQQKSKQYEADVKRYAKTNNMEAAKVLARQIAASRKSVNRLYSAKAELKTVCMSLDHQVAVIRMSGAMKSSTDVMKSMSNLVRLPELNATMRDLSKEMMRMGIMEEMIDEGMDSALGHSEDMDEVAQEEVDKILFEVTQGAMGKAPEAVTDTLPAGYVPSAAKASTPAVVVGDDDDEDLDAMRARLDALRS